MNNSNTFKELIHTHHPSFALPLVEQIVRFYELVCQENETQNLTRLLSPADFYYGHLLDVLFLLDSPWLTFPAMDLGSGVGIPGILAGLIHPKIWVLAESEGQKADYLARTVATLGLATHISIFKGRGEEYLREYSVETIVARAVGPLNRIYSWVRNCSTWNNLVLFKGPKWTQEWEDFQQTSWKNELKVAHEQIYTVGPEKKQRIIVFLSRVPRGTIRK